MQWRNRAKRNDQVLHVKPSFFHLADKKCLLHFLLLVMLFNHVEKRSNSRSQIFFKTGVLKYFAMFTGKYLCWSRFLIKFQNWRSAFLYKKGLQHRYFYVNIGKLLKRHFYSRPVHYTFPKFYLMKDNCYFRVKFYYCRLRFYKGL